MAGEIRSEDDGRDLYPVAYCAPGQRLAAALTLMFKGEPAARIVEHPWLEGKTEIYVIAKPPELLGPLSSLLS